MESFARSKAELYDLRDNPFETRNLVGEPGTEPVVEELRGELGRLSLEALGLGAGGSR